MATDIDKYGKTNVGTLNLYKSEMKGSVASVVIKSNFNQYENK